MDQLVAPKSRTIIDAEVVTTATATGYPTFPTGPNTSGKVVFAGDMQGARIAGFRWTGSMSGFSAADLTVQRSPNGEDWFTLKAFTQQTGATWDVVIDLLDSDPKPYRFIRGLVDMTGTPGTSTHTLKAIYDQIGPRGPMADGIPDRAN